MWSSRKLLSRSCKVARGQVRSIWRTTLQSRFVKKSSRYFWRLLNKYVNLSIWQARNVFWPSAYKSASGFVTTKITFTFTYGNNQGQFIRFSRQKFSVNFWPKVAYCRGIASHEKNPDPEHKKSPGYPEN